MENLLSLHELAEGAVKGWAIREYNIENTCKKCIHIKECQPFMQARTYTLGYCDAKKERNNV